MTVAEFRRLALCFPGTIESAHMQHPDFRVQGKIFASLGYPGDEWGMVKLTLAQQARFVREASRVFQPCNGAWGRHGATQVRLAASSVPLARSALEAAWRNLAEPAPGKKRAR